MKLRIIIICLVGAFWCINATQAKVPKVQELTNETFNEKIENYTTGKEWKYFGDRPVIIDLYASWCALCRHLSPLLDEIQQENERLLINNKS